jgi:nucleoside-diphosphate-sugar epimerase
MMTQAPVSEIPDLDMDAYRVQKIALEEAVKQIRYRRLGIPITIVRPGNIATSPDKTVPPSADVNHWAKVLVGMFDMASPNLFIKEISLGPA